MKRRTSQPASWRALVWLRSAWKAYGVLWASQESVSTTTLLLRPGEVVALGAMRCWVWGSGRWWRLQIVRKRSSIIDWVTVASVSRSFSAFDGRRVRASSIALGS